MDFQIFDFEERAHSVLKHSKQAPWERNLYSRKSALAVFPAGAFQFLAGASQSQPGRLPAISRGWSTAIPPDQRSEELHPESGASNG